MRNIKQKISFELQNHLIPWIIAMSVLLFFILFMYENRGIFIAPREVEHTVLQLNKGEETLGEITDDSVITQSFISNKDNFSRIQIPFGTFNRQNEGILKFKLRDVERKIIIDQKEINIMDLSDGTYTNFDFERVNHAKGKKFEIIFTSQVLQNGKSVTLWKSIEDQYNLGKLTINGYNTIGDLKFNVLDVESKPLLSKQMFIVIGMLLLIIFISTLVAVRVFKDKMHKVFLVIVLPIGIALSIIIPPFDQLDELEHFYRAYEVSEGKFTNQAIEQGLGNYIPVSLVDTVNKVRYIHQEGLKYSIVNEAFSIRLNPEERVFLRNYASSYPPIIYIPQSLGIIIGKILDASPILMMYLGRIFNFLFYLMITYIALKIVPIKKNLFFLLALLPMSIIHAASLSADAITNSTALLFVSYILYLAYGSVEKITVKHVITTIAIGIFIALSKIVYLPIILLFLIIPIRKLKNKKDYWVTFIIVLTGCTIPFIIWNLLNISNLSVPDLRVNPGVSPKDQVIFVLTHPVQYIKIIIDTMMSIGPSQVLSMMGKIATNYMYPTPSIVIYTFLFMLFFFGIVNSDKDLNVTIRGVDKLIFLAIFLLVLILIYTALYVGFTNVGDPIINGIQGRYFVPIAAYFFLSLSNYKITNKDKNLDFLFFNIIHSSMFALLLQYIVNINS